METTWIDVADNAVKIGLGVLLGGFFASLGEMFRHRRQKSSDLSDYKRDMLKDISVLFGDYFSVLNNTLYAYHILLHRSTQGTLEPNDEIEELDRIRTLKSQLEDQMSNLTHVYNQLLLLDAKKAAEILLSINSIRQDVLHSADQVIEADISAYDNVLEAIEKIRLKRTGFYAELTSQFHAI